MRETLSSKSMADMEKGYVEYYAKSYPKIKATDTITVHDDRVRNEITMIEKYSIPEFYKRDSVSGVYNASFYTTYVSIYYPNYLATESNLFIPDLTQLIIQSLFILKEDGILMMITKKLTKTTSR